MHKQSHQSRQSEPAAQASGSAIGKTLPAVPVLQKPGMQMPEGVTAQLQSVTNSIPIQLAKNEQQRGEKQRRKVTAQATIAALGNSLKPKLAAHIYEGTPIDKAVDEDDPQGLHAYPLPGNIEGEVTKGSPGRVHELTWNYTGNENTKQSTMFPDWMPKAHVNTLIALKFPAVSTANVESVKAGAAKTRQYIQHGQDIAIEKSGDTVYPTM